VKRPEDKYLEAWCCLSGVGVGALVLIYAALYAIVKAVAS
jgi:hypothetical protein